MIWKITFPSNKSYVISAPTSYDELVDMVNNKYSSQIDGPFCFKYIDSEDEFINLFSEEDFETAIISARKEKLQSLQIFVLPVIIHNSSNLEKTVDDNGFKINGLAEKEQTPERRTKRRSNTNYSFGQPGNRRKYRTKLPLVSEAQVQYKGSMTLASFGNKKRGASCPVSISKFQPETYRTRLSSNFKKSLSDKKFENKVDKLTQEKIEEKINERIQEAVPVIANLLRGIYKSEIDKQSDNYAASHSRKSLSDKENRQCCYKCSKPVDEVKCVCTGCLNEGLSGTKDVSKEQKPITRRKTENFNNRRCNANLINRLGCCREINQCPLNQSRTGMRAMTSCPGNLYKVCLQKTKEDSIIEVGASEAYKVGVELKNCGENKWPGNTRLVCINGANKGLEKMLPSLNPNEKTVVELSLCAPKEPGKHLSQWRVSYEAGSSMKSFGESLFDEIHVSEKNKNSGNSAKNSAEKIKKSEETFDGRQHQESEKFEDKESPFKTMRHVSKTNFKLNPEKAVPEMIKCEEDKKKYANYLNEIFPGSLEEKIRYVNGLNYKCTIFDAVEKYLIKNCKNRCPYVSN